MLLRTPEGRAVRMLIALLAATDPLGKIDAGKGPDAYEPLATRVLAVMQQGGGPAHVVAAIQMQAPGNHLDGVAERAAVAVSEAVADWWVNARETFELAVA